VDVHGQCILKLLVQSKGGRVKIFGNDLDDSVHEDIKSRLKAGECLLSLDAEFFCLPVCYQKICRNTDIRNNNFASFFVWV